MYLPQHTGDKVARPLEEIFMSYATPKVGDFCLYNPNLDRFVIVDLEQKPEYIVREVKKRFLKTPMITIEKL